MIIHPIPPLFDKNSKTLILGSFPSVKSRESSFFYGHKQNRFWQVIAAIFNKAIPNTLEEKKQLLLDCNIALWDVIGCCDIEGSADSTIKNVTPNNLDVILKSAPIKRIFVNGKTALKYYNQLILPIVQQPAFLLPSTSPANASYSLNKLIQEWEIIKN